MTLQTQRVQSLEQVRAFLEGSEAVDFVEGDCAGVYDLIRRTLVKSRYHRLGKSDKGLVKRYLGKVSGLVKGTAHAPAILILAPDFTFRHIMVSFSSSIRAKSTARTIPQTGVTGIMRIAGTIRDRLPHRISEVCIRSSCIADTMVGPVG